MPCSETKVLTELREQAPAQIEALRAEQHNAEAEAQEAERRAAELRARADGITISTRWLDGQLPRGDGKAARPILPWSIAAAGQPGAPSVGEIYQQWWDTQHAGLPAGGT